MKNKIIHTFIFIVFLFTFSACGDNSAIIPENSQSKESELSETLSWTDYHSSLNMHYDTATIIDDVIYGAYLDETNLTAVAQDLQSGNILSKTSITGVSDIQSITADAQQNIYILGTSDEEYIFWKIDRNGQVSVCNNFELEDYDYHKYLFPPLPKGIFADNKGYFYFWYELHVPLREFDKEAAEDVYTVRCG